MKPSHLAFVALVASFTACYAAEQKKDETIELPPYTHTAYWQDFTVSKDSPMSDDGRYRLKEVRKNGDVELLDWSDPEHPTSFIVKPKPKKLKAGETVPTIVVLEADAVKQSATISEMRLK
jgi:hypothetical protein